MGQVAMLFGVWLIAVGSPFAIWPAPASHIADRLRLQPQKRASPREVRYARLAGIALATLGVLIVGVLAVK
jgi:DNA-binding helix-hairpin-helix protein with protein kinase domain